MRMEPGEERLEQARVLLPDVDEVQGARVDGSRTLHLNERCDRVGRIDEEEVLARRDTDEDHERHEQQGDDQADDTPGCELPPQNRNRFSPPSTTSVWPVT